MLFTTRATSMALITLIGWWLAGLPGLAKSEPISPIWMYAEHRDSNGNFVETIAVSDVPAWLAKHKQYLVLSYQAVKNDSKRIELTYCRNDGSASSHGFKLLNGK